MSTSSDASAAAQTRGPHALSLPELRDGQWTRLGTHSVLGDRATEGLLGDLAESTRRAAKAQGYAVGWAEGRRAAEESARVAATVAGEQLDADRRRHEVEHQEALQALQTLAVELRAATAEACSTVDGQAALLALELTRELVGGTAAESGSRAVERVRGLMPEHPLIRARLHPDVAATAESLTDAGVQVIADPALGRADAVAETEVGVWDLRIDTALERLREALS